MKFFDTALRGKSSATAGIGTFPGATRHGEQALGTRGLRRNKEPRNERGYGLVTRALRLIAIGSSA
jgi:hypothetical protein